MSELMQELNKTRHAVFIEEYEDAREGLKRIDEIIRKNIHLMDDERYQYHRNGCCFKDGNGRCDCVCHKG